MAKRLNIVAIGQTSLGFALRQVIGGEVIPAEFGNEAVPDFDVVLIKAVAIGEAPFQNFLVRTPLADACAELVGTRREET